MQKHPNGLVKVLIKVQHLTNTIGTYTLSLSDVPETAANQNF